MPTYEYKCGLCSCRFEIKQSFQDNAEAICHRCGGNAQRIFSPVPIMFKGPGFYTTDIARKEGMKPGSKGNGDNHINTDNHYSSAEAAKNRQGILI